MRQSGFPPSIWAQIFVVALAGELLTIAIPTGPEPSVMKVIVRGFARASVDASSCRLLNVTCAIGALARGVAVGPAVGMAEAVGDGEVAGELEDCGDPETEGATAGDGAGRLGWRGGLARGGQQRAGSDYQHDARHAQHG